MHSTLSPRPKPLSLNQKPLCATVGLTIESDNVVGYQEKGIDAFSLAGATFTKVDGGENITFADYAVNCNEKEESAKGWIALGDVFNTYSAIGSFTGSYYYCPQWMADALAEELGYPVAKGWYNVNDEEFLSCASATKVGFGEGIVAKASGDGAAITFSGSVKKDPTVTDIAAFTIVGNSSPVEIKLGQIVVNCNEKEETSTGWIALGDVINTYTAEGSFDKSYYYCPQWMADALAEELGYPVAKGWYDVNDEGFLDCCNEKVAFGAGSGFIAKSSGSGATLTIKSALAN